MSYKENVELMYKAMGKALALKHQNNYQAALSVINDFLSHTLDSEQRSEALSFRANLKEEIGQYEEASKDLLTALSLSKEGSYIQYTLELSLGGIFEKLGVRDEALSWYRKALLTCTKGTDIVGGAALKKFLELKGENNFTDQEKALCQQVVERSWTLLRIPGRPALSNLKEVSEILIHSAGKPSV
jgi:tetratricopeptide (TPR) repeat protein